MNHLNTVKEPHLSRYRYVELFGLNRDRRAEAVKSVKLPNFVNFTAVTLQTSHSETTRAESDTNFKTTSETLQTCYDVAMATRQKRPRSNTNIHSRLVPFR